MNGYTATPMLASAPADSMDSGASHLAPANPGIYGTRRPAQHDALSRPLDTPRSFSPRSPHKGWATLSEQRRTRPRPSGCSATNYPFGTIHALRGTVWTPMPKHIEPASGPPSRMLPASIVASPIGGIMGVNMAGALQAFLGPAPCQGSKPRKPCSWPSATALRSLSLGTQG